MSHDKRRMVRVTLDVDREVYEKFVHLLHNFNAIKNAGDPQVKASVVSVKGEVK